MAGSMRFRYIRNMLTAALILLPMTGCAQYLRFAWGPVPEARRVYPVEEKPTYGYWRGADLTLDYNYLKTQDVLDIAGGVDFNGSTQMDFESIDSLHVFIYFLDDRGEILGTHGLANPAFHSRLILPKGTKSIAFSYEGEASTGGGSGENVTAWIHDGPG